jgi:TRAP-type mannitol/chloroaromatic compound transport system permease small subunit
MSGLLSLSRAIDLLNEKIGKTAAWALVIAVLVSAINALIRKIFGTSSNAWLELQWYLFGAVFMLCASWALRCNEHIRIDIVSSKMSQTYRHTIELVGHAIFLGSFVLVMVYTSWPFFLRSYASGEMSPNAGGLIVWPAKILILIGFIFLGLQALSEFIKRVAIIRGLIPDEHAAGGHHAAAEAEAARLLNELKDEASKR